jgi:hypothetical protein
VTTIPRMPGFVADVAVARPGQPYGCDQNKPRQPGLQTVVPQSRFTCGLALAGFVGGFATGSPALALGSFRFILSEC